MFSVQGIVQMLGSRGRLDACSLPASAVRDEQSHSARVIDCRECKVKSQREPFSSKRGSISMFLALFMPKTYSQLNAVLKALTQATLGICAQP